MRIHIHYKQSNPPPGAFKNSHAGLTLREYRRKSNVKVSLVADSLYAQWRVCAGAASVLRDDGEAPPERLLQAIWQHQRIQRDRLKTLEGRAVRVLHPGFASLEGGPDFRGAVIQFGDEAPRSGDVEIDLRAGGWRAHGHDRNPAFRHVLLHVVWNADRPSTNGPQLLPLSGSLDAPLGELSLWLEKEPAFVLPENFRGRCSVSLRDLDEAQVTELLRDAAWVRFQAKAARFQARARHAGWEQALWEGLFRALGYKHNAWPMQNLAEARAHWAPGAESVFALQVRLLGMSGLLPAELTRAQQGTDHYLRRVWDGWWRERDAFAEGTLPGAIWRFHGLRPANHPQRRLALAAHWLASVPPYGMIARLENWCATDLPDRALRASLAEVLQIETDEFWSWHWTFRSARLKRPQPLLGTARITDLAVNVILPWLWIRAAEGKNEKLQRVIEHRYAAWSPAGDNSILKLARQRLLGGSPGRPLRSAAAQQGLMQIVRDFCEHSDAICGSCRFPDLVQAWGAPPTRATA